MLLYSLYRYDNPRRADSGAVCPAQGTGNRPRQLNEVRTQSFAYVYYGVILDIHPYILLH